MFQRKGLRRLMSTTATVRYFSPASTKSWEEELKRKRPKAEDYPGGFVIQLRFVKSSTQHINKLRARHEPSFPSESDILKVKEQRVKEQRAQNENASKAASAAATDPKSSLSLGSASYIPVFPSKLQSDSLDICIKAIEAVTTRTRAGFKFKLVSPWMFSAAGQSHRYAVAFKLHCSDFGTWYTVLRSQIRDCHEYSVLRKPPKILIAMNKTRDQAEEILKELIAGRERGKYNPDDYLKIEGFRIVKCPTDGEYKIPSLQRESVDYPFRKSWNMPSKMSVGDADGEK